MSRNDDGVVDGITMRAMGQYKISIASSLALEYITGIHEERPMKVPPIKRYNQVAINIATLARNFIGSLDPVNKLYLTADHAKPALYAEINTFKNVLEDHKASLILYHVDYSSLGKEFPHAIIKEPRTPAQKLEATLIKDLCIAMNKFDFTVNQLKSYKETALKNTDLIMTHYPVDLIPNNKLLGADLLESHTGLIKDRYQWSSKLGLGDYKDLIPFSKLAITVFGDRATQFLSGPARYKNPVIEIAKQYGWNSKTTDSRMRSSLERLPDRAMAKTLIDML